MKFKTALQQNQNKNSKLGFIIRRYFQTFAYKLAKNYYDIRKKTVILELFQQKFLH